MDRFLPLIVVLNLRHTLDRSRKRKTKKFFWRNSDCPDAHTKRVVT
jgi:hypothetical protein